MNDLLREILEEPEALRRLYQAYVTSRNLNFEKAVSLIHGSRNIFLSGMATSEYATYSTSAFLTSNGINNYVYDVSELLYYHLPTLFQKESCLVLVSQSGNSAEIVHIINEVKGKTPIIGIFNDEESYLAKNCDIPLPIFAGPQLACGSKTNLSTTAILLLLSATAAHNNIQSTGEKLLAVIESIEKFLQGWETAVEPIVNFLQDAPYTVFLGRGPGRASAMFSAIIFREVPKVVAEGMGAAAFRHGLREMIRPEHRVVIFAPESKTHLMLLQLGKDLLQIGIPVLFVTNKELAIDPDNNLLVLKLDSYAEIWMPLLEMVPLQLAGYKLAERYGIEPGKLVISNYVTTVE